MNWLRQIWQRRRMERDLYEEIGSHIEERADELTATGMSCEDAVRQARREFGNATGIAEAGREVWRWGALEDFAGDSRFALRQLGKNPVFAAAAVLTLALGIGANTAVFSVINAVLLRPLPYPDSGQLVSVMSRTTRGDGPRPETLSYPTYFDFRRMNTVFEHIACFRADEASLSGTGAATHLRAAIVSANLFAMLGVHPALGRGFLPEEEQPGARVVVISDGLWRSRFGADPQMAGRVVTIDGQPHTVVGVAPAGFQFPPTPEPLDVWLTLARDRNSATLVPVTEERGSRMLLAAARLKKGVAVERAQQEMDRIAGALAKQYPDQNRQVAATYVQRLNEALVRDGRDPMWVLFGAVFLVLLIACANLANLLLARTSERVREFALRASIGASRARLIRQMVTESLIISLLGCAVGIAGAFWLLRYVMPLAGNGVPRMQEATQLDATVLLFAAGLSLITALLASLAPALRLRRAEFAGSLQEGSRASTGGGERTRSALVVVQIALGMVLLSAAGLLTTSLTKMLQRDFGLQPGRVLTFNVTPSGPSYPDERRLAFHARLLERLRNLPGAREAALGMPLPLTGSSMSVAFQIQDRPTAPHERPRSNMAIITPGYFRTIGARMLRGRDFNERDNDGAPPVLVVNDAFARQFFPGEEALGRRITPGATGKRGTRMHEIIGIVGDARQSALGRQPDPIYYFSYAQLSWCCPSVLVRSDGDPSSLQTAVVSVVAELDPQLPVFETQVLSDQLDRATTGPRFVVTVLGGFAALAQMLTLVGLYGVLAYSVERRRRELGLRMALGAGREKVIGLVVRKVAVLVFIGVAFGLAGSLATGQLLAQILYETKPSDPLLLGVTCGLVALTAELGAYVPARRAARIDPAEALRAE
ncbi:MAG: ABC transporter permease [Acidobacteriota bacterium]